MAKSKKTPGAAKNKNSDKGKSLDEQFLEIRASLPNAQKDGESNWTFSGIFEEYLLRPDLEDRENDVKRFRNYLEADFGDRAPSEVVQEDIGFLRLKLQNNQLKPSSERHVLELLQRLADYASKKKFCPGLSFEIQMPTVENQKTENNPALTEKLIKTPEKSNDFLSKLLHLQQDGNDAISAPTKWLKERPLLKIKIPDIDKDVDELVEKMLKGKDGNTTGRWHFFIGSPGNGKSAAIGEICYKLKDKCRIENEEGKSINELDSNEIPYELRIFEGENKFYSAMVIQDASVVPNPFAKNVDPSVDLLNSVEKAWEKGVSLLVCTNRGVIEKAVRDKNLDDNYNKKKWFKILKQLVEKEGQQINYDPWEFEPKKVFKNTILKSSYLDNNSLLIDSNIFDDLIKEATRQSNWEPCGDCEDAALCPFKANRNWLADTEARGNFLNIMRRAEVLSGQVIVFREALAIISLLLAGCPIDYKDQTPCEWVSKKRQAKDIFALAMRRIYMCMFSSFSSYGLETAKISRETQEQSLKSLQKKLDNNSDAKQNLKHVTGSLAPSTDVGVKRLLGQDGTIPELDAWRDGLSKNFLDSWDSDYSEKENKHFTEIEKQCVLTWSGLEKIIESNASYESVKWYQSLRRWSSNFLLHFGMLLEGKTSWANELDDFIDVLRVVRKNKNKRNDEDRKKIRETNIQLGELLTINASGIQTDIVELSENVKLAGDWLNQLKPKINETAVSRGPFLNVKFSERDNSENFTLSARAFIWQKRHSDLSLDPGCFPREFFIGMIDARIRAASSNKNDAYAFIKSGVELLIQAGESDSLKLVLDEWEVF